MLARQTMCSRQILLFNALSCAENELKQEQLKRQTTLVFLSRVPYRLQFPKLGNQLLISNACETTCEPKENQEKYLRPSRTPGNSFERFHPRLL
jgi:hypothetical protein